MSTQSEYVTLTTHVGALAVRGSVPRYALLLSFTAAWTERVRRYGSIAELGVDFATTTAEYRAGAKYFRQRPRPQYLYVGRCALPPTQKRTITPVAADNTDYELYVGDHLISIDSGASATATTITTALKSAINAFSATINCTATGTATTILTADVAGGYDRVKVLNPALLGIVQDHADPGVATDLAAIANENSGWTAVINTQPSELMTKAIDTWCAANKKVQIVASQDSKIATDAVGLPATDLAFDLKTAATASTAVMYHDDDGEFAHAAWTASILASLPGKTQPAFMTLDGVAATVLTSTHRANILEKNASYYDSVDGQVNITYEGKTGAGTFIDRTLALLYVEANIQADQFNLMRRPGGVPYTDAGIADHDNTLRTTLDRMVKEGIFSLFETERPTLASQTAGNVSNRRLSGLLWTADGAGRINGVSVAGEVTE